MAAGAGRAGDLLGRRGFTHRVRTLAVRPADPKSPARPRRLSDDASRSSVNSCSYCSATACRRRPALDEAAARGAHARELIRIGDEPAERLRERLGVVGRHRHARARPLDDARRPRCPGRRWPARPAGGQDRVHLRGHARAGRARASAARRGCRPRRAPRAAGPWGCIVDERTFGSPAAVRLELGARRATAVDHEHDARDRRASAVAAASTSSSDCEQPDVARVHHDRLAARARTRAGRRSRVGWGGCARCRRSSGSPGPCSARARAQLARRRCRAGRRTSTVTASARR